MCQECGWQEVGWVMGIIGTISLYAKYYFHRTVDGVKSVWSKIKGD